MNTSLNIVFIKQGAQDEYGSVYVRTIENRVIRKKSLKIKISEKDWHKFFNPSTKRFRRDKTFLNSELYNNTIDEFLKEFSNSNNDLDLIPDEKKSLIDYWQECIKNQTNHGTKIKHQVVMAKLKKYLNSKDKSDLFFKEIFSKI